MELTIGVPVFNAEKSLASCLDSILASEDVADYEIICVDDGSEDASSAILQQYQNEFENIRIIHTTNRGAFLARQRIIEEAAGNWVGFVDADDMICSSMYKRLLDCVEKNPQADMAVCAFYKNHSTQMNGFGNAVYDFAVCPEDIGILLAVNPACWNKIYKKSIAEAAVRLDNPPRIMEDFIFFASIIPNLKGTAFIQEPLYDYRDSPDSATKSVGICELKEAERGIQSLLSFLESRQGYQDGYYMKELIKGLCCIHLGVAFTVNFNQYGCETIHSVWNETVDYLNVCIKGWRNNYFFTREYARRHSQMKKIYLAFQMYGTKAWPVIVQLYHIICRILKGDMKW